MLYQKLSSVLPLDTHEYRFEITPISASKLLRWKGPKISICEISVDLCLNIAARCPNFRGKLVVLENVEDERRTFWKNLWVGAKYHPRKFFVYLPKYLSEPPWPMWSAHPCIPPRIGSGCNGTVMQLFLGCYFGCNLAAWQPHYQLLMRLYRGSNPLETFW